MHISALNLVRSKYVYSDIFSDEYRVLEPSSTSTESLEYKYEYSKNRYSSTSTVLEYSIIVTVIDTHLSPARSRLEPARGVVRASVS